MDEHELSGRWFEMAVESFRSATRAFECDQRRSCVSRAYYAMYQAAMTIFLEAGLTAPGRGNWNHAEMSVMFEDRSVRRILQDQNRQPIRLKQMFKTVYRARIESDYGPRKAIDKAAACDARRYAGEMLGIARRVMGGS